MVIVRVMVVVMIVVMIVVMVRMVMVAVLFIHIPLELYFFHLIAYLQIYLLPYLCLSVVRFVTTGTGKTLMARQIGKMLNTREPKIISGPGKFD